VVVGYYNGAEIGFLNDNKCPDGSEGAGPELGELARLLRGQPELEKVAKITERRYQITLEPKAAVPENRLWDIANQVIHRTGRVDIGVVRSSHSVDILAPRVTKEHVLDRMLQIVGKEKRILKIGDRGRWPGNDFSLLRQPHALSVDELSVDPDTCWNLASPGQRGVHATVEYCRSIRIAHKLATFVP
jgi:hydroxymethylpyrimidine pyrophosphatase-like HAD family hydrolase